MNIRPFFVPLVLVLSMIPVFGETRPPKKVKNVIIMIPDGTSMGVVTLARWFNDNKPLHIDPYICGSIKTYSIDNKIPDSAPTSTAYSTGVKTRAPFIGVDTAAVPRINVMELARMKGLLTGIVVTCEFPHATPADFVCHLDNRESKKYDNLTWQFMYNSPSLVFAGGKSYLTRNNCLDSLGKNGILLTTTLAEFKQTTAMPDSGKRLWGLFPDWRDSTRILAYDCDRDTLKTPSLSQMTEKALQLLGKKKKGFLLMVEGSQVDWAAHYNDPYAAVTEFLAFDSAVGKAIDFAKKDSTTVVIVCPDHCTGGLSIGNFNSNTDILGKNPNKYENINIKERIIDSLKQIKCSGKKLAEMMLTNKKYIRADSISKYYHFMPKKAFVRALDTVSRIKTTESLTDTMQFMLGNGFSRQNFIGWTTTGHTAEDVFLAIYAPNYAKKMTGVVDNSDIGRYIDTLLNLGNMRDSSDQYFCRYTQLFNDSEATMYPESLVIKRNNHTGVVKVNSNRLWLDGEETTLPAIAVYVNKIFYIPKQIVDFFK